MKNSTVIYAKWNHIFAIQLHILGLMPNISHMGHGRYSSTSNLLSFSVTGFLVVPMHSNLYDQWILREDIWHKISSGKSLKSIE